MVRISTAPDHRSTVRAERANARAIASLGPPFAVPRPLGDQITVDGWSGFAVSHLAGNTVPSPNWADVRDPIAEVLQALASVPVSHSDRVSLRPVREWCGAGTTRAGATPR